MIDKISKIARVENHVKRDPLRYNTNLPLSIKVLGKLSYNRYKLILGKREFTAKSLKELKKGESYWGDLNHTKEGIISLSNLVKKPDILDIEEFFLSDELFCDNLRDGDTEKFKKTVINLISKEKDRYKLLSLGYMLQALLEGVIHLPLLIENRRVLFQMKRVEEETLFYMGFENLGPIRGFFGKNRRGVEVLFRKSFSYIYPLFEEWDLKIKDMVNPLFNPSSLLLDTRG